MTIYTRIKLLEIDWAVANDKPTLARVLRERLVNLQLRLF